MTAGQSRARSTLDHFCLDPAAASLDPRLEFGRDAPLGLEIGFGMGQALLAQLDDHGLRQSLWQRFTELHSTLRQNCAQRCAEAILSVCGAERGVQQ